MSSVGSTPTRFRQVPPRSFTTLRISARGSDVAQTPQVRSHPLPPRPILTLYGRSPYNYVMASRTGCADKRTERLDARLSREEKQAIEMAASLRGISVTDLVRISLRDAAARIIRENEVLTLSDRSRKAFVEALVHPPKPNAKALAAAKRFRREVE